MAGTYFNKRRKLGILDKDLGSSDVISVFATERVTRFIVRRFSTCGRIISIEYGLKATSILAPGLFHSPPCFVV